MSGKSLRVVVPVVALIVLAGAGLLLAIALAKSKDTSAVVEARSGAGFPTMPLTDKQGAVSVEVLPLNLGGLGQTLDFRVAMNTHSVELDMNLAEQATLSTDTGLTISPVRWDAPSGGHHVSGTLSFPAEVDGAVVMDGVTELTLTLRNIDVPERVFVWALKPAS